MEIVVAQPEHVDAVVAITEQARANMAAMGIDQWQCGYPDRCTWEADVVAGAAYVALDEGQVVAVFRYADEPEAAYETLEGEWLTDGPYATVHRCAVDPTCRGRGIIGKLFSLSPAKRRLPRAWFPCASTLMPTTPPCAGRWRSSASPPAATSR